MDVEELGLGWSQIMKGRSVGAEDLVAAHPRRAGRMDSSTLRLSGAR